MGYVAFVVTAFALIVVNYSMSELRQERATMDWNPKYLSEGHAFTRRAGRGKSYRTNFTVVTLHAWSNNVTVDISVSTLQNLNLFHIQYSLCDFFIQRWVSDFMNTYSDITPKCPMTAGTHGCYNLVFPPKNFPLPLPNGDIRLRVGFLFKPTNEVMSESSVILRS